jgi:xylan 1,4-beta-xylosidase
MTGSALRLHARESIGSWFEQSLVARRQEHLKLPCRNHGCGFEPRNFQQTAGLVHYYNRHKFHYPGRHLARGARAGADHSELPRRLAGRQKLEFPLAKPVALPGDGPVELAMALMARILQFSYRLPGGDNGRLSARCSMPA